VKGLLDVGRRQSPETSFSASSLLAERSLVVRRSLAFLVPLILAALSGRAADGPGALYGVVRTRDGSPLPGVALRLLGPAGALDLVSGPDGSYRVSGLAAGEYAISLGAPGLELVSEPRAVVRAGAETRHDVVLTPAPVREQLIVSATRSEATLSTLGVSATVLDAERIAERRAASFDDLLREVCGVSVARSGGIGAQSSVFLRGGESYFARVLVDGVPVNEPGGAYNLAGQVPLELERVEVVRGAASSLYGTDALAGVIQVVTRRAAPGEAPRAAAELEGGTFGWRRAYGSSAGRAGRFDWNAGIARLAADNQQPNSRFEQTAGALSAGVELGPHTTLRLLARGETSVLGTPGQTAYGRPDLDAREDFGDLVLGASLRHSAGRAVHVLRVGYSLGNRLDRDPLDSGSYLPQAGDRAAAFAIDDYTNPLGFQNDTRRLSGGYQLDAPLGERQLLTGGVDLEHETGAIGDRRDPALLQPSRTNVGAYVQDRVLLGSAWFLTVGGRVERNASYGTGAVPRVALAYRLGAPGRTTTLRASAGAGIKEPSFLQSFGLFDYARGNADLEPERSRTYDLGVEQRLIGDRLRLQATVFEQDYLDQISYTVLSYSPFQGSYLNLGRTRARGLEISLEAAPWPGAHLEAEYTLLDGTVLESASPDPLYAVGQPLLRRPKHAGSVNARYDRGRFGLGATLLLVGRRSDSDFLGIGLTENPGYARLDLRARLRIGRKLEVYGTAANLLDRSYQEVLGYPAPGRALRVGLRLASAGVGP
jgi:vitamin B12 transporter